MGEHPLPDPEFSDTLARWLTQHGSLIQALVILRRSNEVEALDLLLKMRELTQLRLTWELQDSLSAHHGSVGRPTGSGPIPRVLFDQCRFGLWGHPLGPAGEGLILCTVES